MMLPLAFPGGRVEIGVYGALLVLLAVTSVALFWFQARRPAELLTAMHRMLPADLVCVAGFSYLLYGVEDAFYPVAILLPVVFALHVDRQTAWLIGMASGGAYAAGHLLARPVAGADIILFATTVGAVPLLAGIVADATQERRINERRARVAVEQYEKAVSQLAQRVSELQAVSEITEIVHSSLDFERVGPLVLDILAKVIGVEALCLFVIDKEKSETLFSASVGMHAPSPNAIMADSLSTNVLDEHYACLAIFDHAETMVLLCASAEDVERLSSEERLVLGAVASELVVAVENSRLYRLTKRLAITDELTGIANYRHLQNRLDEELLRAKRYDKHVSLVMIDVDDFKSVNDTQGHITGDSVLRELAEVLSRHVREVDLVARYGGEEFSVVLPETDAPGAFIAAEKLREAVSEHLFSGASGEASLEVTVSLGLATYPAHAQDKETLLREADDALYRAKTGGKNRVMASSTRAGATPVVKDSDHETGPDSPPKTEV